MVWPSYKQHLSFNSSSQWIRTHRTWDVAVGDQATPSLLSQHRFSKDEQMVLIPGEYLRVTAALEMIWELEPQPWCCCCFHKLKRYWLWCGCGLGWCSHRWMRQKIHPHLSPNLPQGLDTAMCFVGYHKAFFGCCKQTHPRWPSCPHSLWYGASFPLLGSSVLHWKDRTPNSELCQGNSFCIWPSGTETCRHGCDGSYHRDTEGGRWGPQNSFWNSRQQSR